MTETTVGREDWDVLMRFLPEGWQEQARSTGALRRARGFANPEVLLRSLMVHLAQGCSLRETAARVNASGLASVSDVALWKRLRGSQEWFRWLCEALLDRLGGPPRDRSWAGGYRVIVVDASVISEPGSTGTDWRLHYGILLESLQCEHFELTDGSGAEKFHRFPLTAGDLIMGDRGYAHPSGMRYVASCGADSLLRLILTNVPLEKPSGGAFNPLSRASRLRIGEVGEWDAVLAGRGKAAPLPVRVCAIKKSRESTERARKRIRREASKRGRQTKPETLKAAAYIIVLTTADGDRLPAKRVLELYRARWQIELAFKRIKSIIDIKHLPKVDPQSARAWLHGKLFVSLLTEALVQESKSFSPWGYPIRE